MGYILTPKGTTESLSAMYAVLYFSGKVYVGCDGLTRYDIDTDGAFTNRDDPSFGVAFPRAFATDGTYLYMAGAGGSLFLHAKSISAWDTASVSYNIGSQINTIACDASGYIYVGCENGHIYIFTFDGSSFTLRHDEDVGHELFRLIFDGLNIIGGYDDNHIRAYVWNGSTFTFVDDEDLSGDVSGLYWDGVNLYSAGGWSNRLRAHPWDQSSFGTLIDEIDFDGGSWAVNIVGDGQYVYSAEPGTRLGVYQLSGSTLSLVSSIIDTDIPYQYHTLCFGGGFVFWCSGNYVKSARMDLTAAFTVDKTSGAAGSTFTFTGVA